MRAESGRFCNEALEKPEVKQGQDRHRGGCVDMFCAMREGRKPVLRFCGIGRNVAGLSGDCVKHCLSAGKCGL